MKKEFLIDIKQEKQEIMREWEHSNTNKSFKQFMKLKKNQKRILDKYKQILDELEIETVTNLTIIFDYPQRIKLTFEWKEDRNIYQWDAIVNEDIKKLQNYFWSKGINAHKAS